MCILSRSYKQIITDMRVHWEVTLPKTFILDWTSPIIERILSLIEKTFPDQSKEWRCQQIVRRQKLNINTTTVSKTYLSQILFNILSRIWSVPTPHPLLYDPQLYIPTPAYLSVCPNWVWLQSSWLSLVSVWSGLAERFPEIAIDNKIHLMIRSGR